MSLNVSVLILPEWITMFLRKKITAKKRLRILKAFPCPIRIRCTAKVDRCYLTGHIKLHSQQERGELFLPFRCPSSKHQWGRNGLHQLQAPKPRFRESSETEEILWRKEFGFVE